MNYGYTPEERSAYVAKMKKKRNFLIGAAVTTVLLLFVLISVASSIEVIKPGYAGVVYNKQGGIEGGTLGQGWHFVSPLKEVTSYPVSTENVFMSKDKMEGSPNDDSFDINTRDGKPVNVDVSYAYHYDIAKLPAVFTKFRGAESKSIEAGYIRQAMKASINNVSSLYGVMDVYGEKRSELQMKVFEAFRDRLKDEGIVIESFTFLAIRPDAQSMQAIQAKVDAMQKLEQSKIEQQQAEIAAETARVKAKGEADSKLIAAEGEAKANSAIQKTLTPELIQMELAKKWNGEYPSVMAGNSGVMLQMPAPATVAGK